MKKRNEHTGKDIASRAAALLAHADEFVPDQLFYIRRRKGLATELAVDDVVSWAASLVTQAEDRANRETLRKGGIPKGHKLVRRHKPIARNGKARAKK